MSDNSGGALRLATTQRTQYPLVKEYTLNYKGLNYYDLRYIPYLRYASGKKTTLLAQVLIGCF